MKIIWVLNTEFNEEIVTLQRTQAEIKMEQKTQGTPHTQNEQTEERIS